MNKTTSTILMLLLFCSSISFAQSTQELKTSALRDAKRICQATFKMDFNKSIDYMHPGFLKMMGGNEMALELLKSKFNTMKEAGFVFEKSDALEVSDVVLEDGEYRCYVEAFNQVTMNGKRIKTKSYLFGIYNAEAKSWYFIDIKQLKNEAMMNQVLPNFKTSLEIPDDEVTTEDI
ncbi:hypothetical protein [Flavivirga jejuensis]|uniref:Nuclear transport factor 2 family protein n=1 Tax=Flavivirga jejuensis TaxID=870487 RepID=A0ABT8WQJ0_9FLAO|nr:hypothetical protein [Flavivirga jejuensis]MDO5975404.1 hypothetical protein [Flavivirga jejuensis]